jgi:hypothetical protein
MDQRVDAGTDLIEQRLAACGLALDLPGYQVADGIAENG